MRNLVDDVTIADLGLVNTWNFVPGTVNYRLSTIRPIEVFAKAV
jgi:hypothetical protein